MIQTVIMDNGEKLMQWEPDSKVITAYKNTAEANQVNIVRICTLTDTTSVITLHKRFLLELAELLKNTKL